MCRHSSVRPFSAPLDAAERLLESGRRGLAERLVDRPVRNTNSNGFSDDLDGQRFTWHAVLADGASTSSSSAGSSGDSHAPGGTDDGFDY